MGFSVLLSRGCLQVSARLSDEGFFLLCVWGSGGSVCFLIFECLLLLILSTRYRCSLNLLPSLHGDSCPSAVPDQSGCKKKSACGLPEGEEEGTWW